MQKFMLKSSAALMLAGISSQLFAAVSPAVDVLAPTLASTYATELSAAGQVIGNANINVLGDIGFGVSAGQTRFVRFDLTNGSFASAVVAADLTTAPATMAANITVVQGGLVGQTSVIFQITADGAGLAPADDLLFALGSGVGVTVTAIAPVGLQYRLYETATAASNPGSNLPLTGASATVASFGTGYSFTSAPNTTTANVATSYRTFVADPTLPFDGFVSTTQAGVGAVSFAAVPGVVRPSDGLQVTLADLVTAPVNLSASGTDLNSLVGQLTLDNDGNGTDCDTVSFTSTGTGNTRTFALGGPVTLTNAVVCYGVAGTPTSPSISAQSFTSALDLTALSPATTVDPTPVALGSFVQNGTVLKVPFFHSNSAGITTVVHLANSGTAAAPYTVSCISGNAAPFAGTPGTVPAGRSVTLGRVATGCPGNANTAIFTINSAVGNVIGSLVRTSTSSGESGFDAAIGSQ